MLSDEQKEQLATEIVPLFQELEQDVIKDIARRVHKTDRWTETAELQVKALEKLGYSPAKIQAEVWKTLRADPEYKKIVAENTLEYKHAVTAKINDIVKQAQAAGDDIIGRAGNMDFADDVDIWAAQGRHLKKSPALEQIGEVMAKRLRGDLKTLSKSTGFRTMGMPVKVTQAYNHALDRAITNVASGAFSSSQAVEMAVDEMEKSGLRKIDFASGVTRNLDVAAMLAVRTTISQMAGEISLTNAESLGTDLVEVSSHPGARTGEGHGNHATWQGKVYSISGRPHPEESKRLGYTIEKLSYATGYPDDPAGLKGYNCRHDFYPFIEGVSEPTPMAKEPDPVTIDGKTYTYYQATQKQRAMERELRELKRRYIGGRKELAGAIKAKEQQYARYCEKAGLKQNLNRLYVKGYKRDFQYLKPAKEIPIENTPFDITENGKYKRLPNMTVNQYANYISPYVADQFRGPNNPNGLNLRDYNQLWDKKNGYIQASPSYKYINDFWRGTLWPKTLTREQKRTRYVMQKATAQFELPDNYVGIRKVDREYIRDFLNVDPGGTGKGFDPQSQNSVQKAVDAINNKISTGKLEVSDKAVTSVSLVENLNYFKMRAVQIEIQMPKGTKGLLTDNFMESEFIAKNNSTLEFIGAERYDYVDTRGRNMHGIKLFARMIQ